VNGAGALCEDQGEGLRRALAVAFADEALARRCTAAAFARAHRRWRAVASLPDPMAWVDVTAVRRARRRLAVRERRWRPVEPGPGDDDLLAGLPPRARVAVVLHALRGRSLDDVADALATSPAAIKSIVRHAYGSLGVVDVELDDDAVPYAD
jgi:DNA-directed RNA polymerase specialized sigma24 family protein